VRRSIRHAQEAQERSERTAAIKNGSNRQVLSVPRDKGIQIDNRDLANGPTLTAQHTEKVLGDLHVVLQRPISDAAVCPSILAVRSQQGCQSGRRSFRTPWRN
jgi:hypothetical protein